MNTRQTIHRTLLSLSLAFGGLLLPIAPLSAQTTPQRSRSAQTAAPTGVVNIKEASIQELQRLPGIGTSKAEAIVELRERVRRFRQVEDILHVPGIGRRTFRTLRPMLTITGATTLGAPQSP